MNHTVPMRETLAEVSSSPTVEFFDGGRQWQVARAHAALLESSDVDWFHLEDCPKAALVKRNSQRDVWCVRVGGREYFAKLYHPNGVVCQAKLLIRGAAALREWNVGRYASAHSVAAVVPVATAWTGPRGWRGPSLLITEAVAGSIPLNDYWRQIGDHRAAADALTDSVARLIARAHQCGFQHDDMHPGNILVRPNGHERETFFVDLHKVRTGRPVGLRGVVVNLAQLNQWFRRHATRTQLRRFLRHYLAYRDLFAGCSPLAQDLNIEPADLIADLAVEADRHAGRLWAKRDRRSRRSGRYFARIRPAPGWRGHVLLHSKHPAPTACVARQTFAKRQWGQWLAEPLSWVDPRQHELLKDSHTATVRKALLPIDGPDGAGAAVIVKRPLARNGWKRLGQMFGRSRNSRSWRIANMLLNRNLPAAQPLAVVERYLLGIVRLDSISLTDFVPASVDLETFLTRDVGALDMKGQRVVKNHLIGALVKLIKEFHARGFVHRDFKAPNVLVSWDSPCEGRPRLTLIDMDGISHVCHSSERQRKRAIVRLAASLLDSPACTRTDRLRFLLRYLTGPGRTPIGWKDHWRSIERLVSTKMRDKQAHRQWKLDRYGRP
jgi:tRNA A-37 threonylcarbamoyl transferase component Bud32